MNLKIIILGDYKSGKSSFIRRYLKSDFIKETVSTVGFNVSKKTLKKEEEDVQIAIWDTGGLISQIPPTKDKIFNQIDGALIIIDASNPNAVKSIKKWYIEIKNSISYDIPIFIIISKKDLILDQKLFNEEEIKKTVNELELKYFLVSARSGENINESFSKIINSILESRSIKLSSLSSVERGKYTQYNLKFHELKVLEELEAIIAKNAKNPFKTSIHDFTKLKEKGFPVIFEIDDDSFGVQIKNGSITGLGLFNCNLDKLPDSFSNLNSLRKLTLRCNPLNVIPYVLTDIKNLQDLDLALTNLVSITQSIQKLRKLRKINLENNHITVLPEEFGELKLLEKINLENNPIISLPNSFCNFELLKELYLEAPAIFYKGNLKKLPKNFGNLKNLEILDLSSCELKQLPLSIGNLISLRVLDLYNNNLNSVPDSIGNLKVLEYLNLENNCLKSLPNSIGDLVNLKVIKLNNNLLQKKGSDKFKALAFKSKGTRYERLMKISEKLKHEESFDKIEGELSAKRRFNALKPFIYAGLVALVGLLTFLNISFNFQSLDLILWIFFCGSMIINILIGTCIIATISKYFKISVRFYRRRIYKLFDIFVMIYLIWSIRAAVKIILSIELLPTINIFFEFTIPDWLLNLWTYVGYNIDLTFLENIDLFFSHFYFKIFSAALVFWALYRNGLGHIRKTAFEEHRYKNLWFFLILGLFGAFSLAVMNYSNLEPYLSIGYDCGVIIGGCLFIWDINKTYRSYFYYIIILIFGGMISIWILSLVNIIYSLLLSIIFIILYFILRRSQIKKASLFIY